MYQKAKMSTLDLSSIPTPCTPKHGISMLAKNQSFKCVMYDLWDTVQDLLNDGEHSEYAVFSYSETNVAGNRSVSELWTADWWKLEQERLPAHSSILAIIFYIDETNVNFQGRNVHPVYITLGNLLVEYRFFKNFWNFQFYTLII